MEALSTALSALADVQNEVSQRRLEISARRARDAGPVPVLEIGEIAQAGCEIALSKAQARHGQGAESLRLAQAELSSAIKEREIAWADGREMQSKLAAAVAQRDEAWQSGRGIASEAIALRDFAASEEQRIEAR